MSSENGRKRFREALLRLLSHPRPPRARFRSRSAVRPLKQHFIIYHSSRDVPPVPSRTDVPGRAPPFGSSWKFTGGSSVRAGWAASRTNTFEIDSKFCFDSVLIIFRDARTEKSPARKFRGSPVRRRSRRNRLARRGGDAAETGSDQNTRGHRTWWRNGSLTT